MPRTRTLTLCGTSNARDVVLLICTSHSASFIHYPYLNHYSWSAFRAGKKRMDTWHVGNKCLAPYSGNGVYYRATVRAIAMSSHGSPIATVQFSGFTEEENETVNAASLKKRLQSVSVSRNSFLGSSSTPVTSPLQYITESHRLRAKIADLIDEGSSSSDATEGALAITESRCGSKLADKRKCPVATGGQTKHVDDVTRIVRSTATDPPLATTNVRLSVPQPSETDSCSFTDEGFSSEDMEKPLFSCLSSPGDKVPLVLSKQDVDHVIQVPATINRYLREYQREGVKFLHRHYEKREGAILGDDMGLGKTVQVLAFLCAVLGKTGTREDCQRRLPEFLQKKMKVKNGSSRPPLVFLIVCPNSVLYNWLEEIDTWTYCTVGKYHGRERQETLWKALKGKLDVVVTSYETYRIYMDSLLRVQWAGVIVDEVHKIKESGTKITQALKRINTPCRYGLTGTALQNKISELWCVLDWANPNCLGSWSQFKVAFEEPISKGQKFHASKRELADSRKVTAKFSEIRDKWLIRRTKSIISHQLPKKDEKVVFCKLTPLQLSVYRALLESDDMQLVLRQKEPCDCSSRRLRGQCCYRSNAEGEKLKALTLTFMSLLIKVANHVALLSPDTNMSANQRKRARKYCEIAFACHPQFVELSRESRFCTLSDPTHCGKMQILVKLLRVFKRDASKVLLFSYYTQLLNIIEMYLKTTDYEYRRLDGKTPMADRQRYVHEFNTDADIFLFLISTKAGGLGLNLTGANVVVIFDPNWNPSYDLQAQDRAYRIGQHRDVHVYRLVSTGSIEENMYLRQVYKQQLASAAVTSENPMRYFDAVAGDNRQQGELFGLHNMFALRADTSCLTKDLLQRHLKTEEGITMAKYISPPPTAEDSNQTFHRDKPTTRDDTSDSTHSESAHSNHSIISEHGDDHGVASQLFDSDLCETDGGCDKRSDERSDATDELHGRTERHNTSHYKTGCRKPSQLSWHLQTAEKRRRRRPVRSDSSSDEEATTEKFRRGKSILRPDGRRELRSKNRRPDGLPSNATGCTGRSTSGGGLVWKAGTLRKAKEVSVKTKTSENIDAILEESGVAFVHSNLKIVGGSRVEDHVSNAAVRDVYELGLHSQQPANYNVPTLEDSIPESQDGEASQAQRLLHESLLDQSKPSSLKINGTTVLLGQTPRGIRRRQFEDMAKTLEYSSTTDFVRHVLSLRDNQFLELLKDYYSAKYEHLDLAQLYRQPEQMGDKRTSQPKSEVAHCTGKQSIGATKKNRQRAARGEETGERKAKMTERRQDANGARSTTDVGKGQKVRPAVKLRGRNTSCEDHNAGNMVRVKTSRSDTRGDSCVNSTEDDWLPVGNTALSQCLRCVGRNSCVCCTSDTGKSSTAGKKELSRSPCKEESLSFLDDIFFSERTTPRRPPPRNKIRRVRTDRSDSDIEMEDLSDNKFADVGLAKVRKDDSRTQGESLWKRNSKFASRQTEQLTSEDTSMQEKYARSFVANERFQGHKRPQVYVEETLTPAVASLDEPDASCLPETDSF